MTEDELQAIEARADAATPGPWTSDSEVVGWWHGELPGVAVRNQVGHTHDAVAMIHDMRTGPVSGSLRPIEDAAFIASARTDVPALVAEVRRLRVSDERLELVRQILKECDEFKISDSIATLKMSDLFKE